MIESRPASGMLVARAKASLHPHVLPITRDRIGREQPQARDLQQGQAVFDEMKQGAEHRPVSIFASEQAIEGLLFRTTG